MNITLKRMLPFLLLILAIVMVFAVMSFSPMATVSALSADDLTVIAGESVTADALTSVKAGFATAAQGLGLGEAGDVSVAREIILYQDYTSASGVSRMVYNFDEEEYFIVTPEFSSKYAESDNFRVLGAPVTAQGIYNVSGKTKAGTVAFTTGQAQVFEKGVMHVEGGEVKLYVGAVEKAGSNYILHPVIDDQDILTNNNDNMEYFGNVDGEMHPLKDIDIIKNVDEDENVTYTMYADYRACCVKVEYSDNYMITSQYVYAGKNFKKVQDDYTLIVLPTTCYSVDEMVCDGDNPVSEEALSYYTSVKASGTKESLVSAFTSCYTDLLNDGHVAGYRCSKIKMWDLLVLDLRFGDGTTGFDVSGSGERERMTCMVYNPVQDKVYGVYDAFFTFFKEDEGMGRNELGYPESKVMKNKTIGGTLYSEIQIFKNGYIYRTADGLYAGEIGYTYDSASNRLLPTICPSVPDRYGVETARKTDNGVTYINYEKGAIKCELTLNKSKYVYTYYNGRQINMDDYSVSLLSKSSIVKYDSLVSAGTMPLDNNKERISFEDVIKPKLYAKYTELYDSGFLCGFTEEEFKGGWNSVYAQQFVVGDSSSMIFGYERPYVCALVYNRKTNEVYLMKDDVITVWQKSKAYEYSGSPTSDEYQVEGCDYWFQTFDLGMTIRNGNTVVYTTLYSSPEAYVEEMDGNMISYPTHGYDQASGYIG